MELSLQGLVGFSFSAPGQERDGHMGLSMEKMGNGRAEGRQVGL